MTLTLIAVPFVLHRRVSHRRRLRLHGRADRRVEQPDLRRRHPGDRHLRVDARARRARRRRRRGPRSSRSRCSSRPIVFACATISNDNLQDLKTGQLVGASPMRQQIALIVGVVAGAAVIPSVLNLLAKAYGFAGAANVGVVAAESAARAAGDADLRARAGRDRRQPRLEDDRHRRAGRRRPHPARRDARRA